MGQFDGCLGNSIVVLRFFAGLAADEAFLLQVNRAFVFAFVEFQIGLSLMGVFFGSPDIGFLRGDQSLGRLPGSGLDKESC